MRFADLIHRDVIDGVTVYWTREARRPMGLLQFRVGQSDETLRTAGVSHVVEHLTMFGLGRQAFPVNGGVDALRTLFHAEGTEAEVAGFLADAAARVSAPPLDRLDAERRVLRTEAAQRSMALVSQHLLLRYGPRGFGLPAMPEYGLHALSTADVAHWASTRFTAGNAVAYCTFPPPDSLRFALADGARRPIVTRVPIPAIPDKSWMTLQDYPGVAMGLLMPRTTAAATAIRTLTRRLEDRLRHQLGHSYEVSAAWVPLDAHEAMASLFASGLPTELAAVRHEVLSVCAAFAADGPTSAELDRDVDGIARAARDPDALLFDLDACAFNELTGAPHIHADDHVDAVRALTPTEVAAAFAAAAERLTLLDGLDAPPASGQWAAYPQYSTTAVTGTLFAPAARRFWHRRGEELVVGDTGVTLVNRAGVEVFTVHYAECAAILCEGSQVILLGHDGTRIAIDQAYWRHGDVAVKTIHATAPASLVIALDSPPPG